MKGIVENPDSAKFAVPDPQHFHDVVKQPCNRYSFLHLQSQFVHPMLRGTFFI